MINWIPTNFSNLKSKVDKLDVNKLVPAPVDLCKLSDVVKDDVVKKDVYNAKIKNIEDEILLIQINTRIVATAQDLIRVHNFH